MTKSMKNGKTLLMVGSILVFSFLLSAQQQTSDGGYIIAGYSDSYTIGDNDILVYKLTPDGSKQWRKNFGGEYDDYGRFIQQTADGGYILCGGTESYVHGSSGDDTDFLVYKLDAAGQKRWRKNYGGEYYEEAMTIRQTSDGGYILVGTTESYVHGTTGDDYDILVYKLNSAGQKQWRRNFGGELDEHGYDILQTTDGGYAIIGSTDSYSNGDDDFLIYKLNAAGQKQWRKNFGGIDYDCGHALIQNSDGDYIAVGFTQTYVHSQPTGEEGDILVYKLNAAGQKQWRKHYGDHHYETANDVKQTSDGGYVFIGTTGDLVSNPSDFLVNKVDASGNVQWQKTFGGMEWEVGSYIWPTGDGGYFLFGDTDSYYHGFYENDFLVYKLDASGNEQWRKNYGGSGWEWTGRGQLNL